MGRPRNRRLGLSLVAVVLPFALGGCLGWFTQFSSTDGSHLTGIDCPTTSECIAVGSDPSGNPVIRQTSDGGSNWALIDTGFTGDALDAVSCGDAEHCVAVGQGSNALVTSDGGMRWQLSAQLPESNLSSVSCPDATECWATPPSVGASPAPLLHSSDGGMAWTAQMWPLPSNADGSNAYLEAVDCPSSTECVALGKAEYEQTIYNTIPDTSTVFPVSESVLLTTTNGSTWSEQPSSVGPTTSAALSCPTPQFCVAAAGTSTYSLSTVDGGTSWTEAVEHNVDFGGASDDIADVSCGDAQHCVAVEPSFQIDGKYDINVEATSDGGNSWTVEPTSDPEALLSSVACVSATECWAAGTSGGATGSIIIQTLTSGVGSPMISNVNPAYGPASGGTSVTVTGSGFDKGVSSVSFGPASTTNVTVLSDSTLTVTAPSLENSPSDPVPNTMTYDVEIHTALGASAPVAGDQFTYEDIAPAPSLDTSGHDTSDGPADDVTLEPTSSGDLLVAMISTFDAATVKVSGGGLIWTNVLNDSDQVPGDGGLLSVWDARDTTAAPITVDSAISGNGLWDQTLQVQAFAGAGGIGSTAYANGTGATQPSAALMPQAAGSWIEALGFDADSITTVSPTSPSGVVREVLDGSYSDPVENAQMWFLHGSDGTPDGATGSIGAMLSPAGRWDFALFEVIAARYAPRP